jgi:hypothetical protein
MSDAMAAQGRVAVCAGERTHARSALACLLDGALPWTHPGAGHPIWAAARRVGRADPSGTLGSRLLVRRAFRRLGVARPGDPTPSFVVSRPHRAERRLAGVFGEPIADSFDGSLAGRASGARPDLEEPAHG